VVKHVRHLRVFITTAIISMWAYVWMLIVYLWWTPSEVRMGSALNTLCIALLQSLQPDCCCC
jgi:solute carrier family 8 (sodium/calcium exchanger)